MDLLLVAEAHHPRAGVHGVPEEAVPRHFVPHDSGDDHAGVGAEPDADVGVVALGLGAGVGDEGDAVAHVQGHVHDLLRVGVVLQTASRSNRDRTKTSRAFKNCCANKYNIAKQREFVFNRFLIGQTN